MLRPSDIEYKHTKRIMLGTEKINPDFIELAEFIQKTFEAKPINIIYDKIYDGSLPRLGIYFETEEERGVLNKKGRYSDLNRQKEKKIIARFNEILRIGSPSLNAKYQTEKIFIYTSAFESIAKEEANDNISLKKLEKLATDLSQDIWMIKNTFGVAMFFVHTDEQFKSYQNSEEIKTWATEYFKLLAPYNDFNYYNKNTFKIYLDSKQNFDEKYQSNWYYYYK